jgi:hypothetical protein
MWREENDKEIEIEPQGNDLRSIGVSVGDIESDTQTGEDMNAPPPEDGLDGMEVAGPVGTAGNTPGGMPAPAGNGM